MIEPEGKENIQHMIDTMLHFLNGGEVLSRPLAYDENEEEFQLDLNPVWNWGRYEYKSVPIKRNIYTVYSKIVTPEET